MTQPARVFRTMARSRASALAAAGLRHAAAGWARALSAIVLASFAAAALPSCGAKPQLDAGARYFAVHNVIGALGLTPTGAVSRGLLANGQELKVEVALPASCVAVVALGGSGVEDLVLELVDEGGNPIQEERGHGPEAVVRACLERPGTYQARLRMAEGSGEFVLSAWAARDDEAAKVSPMRAAAGTCGAPTPLALGRSYAGNTDDAEDEQEGSCSSSGGHEHVFRLDVPSRQRVTATVGGDFDTVLYLRKGDCTDENSEVRCNDDAGPKRSRIDAVLEPAVYFLFVDGYGGETGDYHLQVTAHAAPGVDDLCRTARALPAGARVVGTLTDAFDNANATCGREAKGGDAPFRLDLASRSRVRLVERSTDFRPVVHVRRVCSDPGSEVACSDAGLGEDEAAWAGVLDAGSYWVYADSADELAQGAFSLSAEAIAEPAAGPRAVGDACADATALVTAAGRVEGDTFLARDDEAVSCAPGNAADVVYRLEVARRSRVSARLTADESSHALALAAGCGEPRREMACGAIVDREVEPGTYFLIVDGARPGALGRFAVSYQVRDLAQLADACTKAGALALGQSQAGSTRGGSDKFASSCGAGTAGQGASDRVYRFAVSKRMAVHLALVADGFRGVLSLRRTCAEEGTTEVKCTGTDDNGGAEIGATLDAGTYYAVVDGWSAGADGRFTLALRGGASGGRAGRDRPPRVTPR